MSAEKKKAIARRFIEVAASADEVRLKEVLAPDFVAHQPGGPQDRHAFLQHLDSFRVAFSDNQFVVKDQIAEGEKVMTRAAWQATHSGDFQGVSATGKEIAIQAIFIERIQDDKIVEHWGLFDQLSMMQQLGLVPPPGPD